MNDDDDLPDEHVTDPLYGDENEPTPAEHLEQDGLDQ